MRAARLHEVGGTFRIDEVERPTPGAYDVVVRVDAANLVPNLRNVINTYPTEKPFLPLPELPAIFGMDVAGTIEEVGSRVRNLTPGTRVYLNPGRDSGDSWAARNNEPMNDPAYTFQGYFGFGPGSKEIHKDYPHGGLCQYVNAPASSVVVIPDSVTPDQASRFGYLGTAYSGLRKGDVRGGSSVLIHGVTGTLGVSAVLLARAMGATKILGVARNKELLERVRKIDPDRIAVLSYGARDVGDWVREYTDGRGADVFLDATGPTATADVTMAGLWALRRGGRMVSIGAMPEPLPLPMYRLMTLHISIFGSLWFTVAEGEDMARMAAAGTLDLSHFESRTFPLEQANEALAAAADRDGGFTSIIVTPHA
ncbi:alcohol dehydrogenase catalytic domain-containing protein [Streptomyces sioyaensis]|uniref:alcohol dehydrogenase catalytic domain-containing protein n=1 Tax=Streptomyces sioyaensis TaxID=67364 RepID=UPI0036B6F936